MPRILIVKTAALGDVLRTTSILPGLRRSHPHAAITWVTAPAALPLVDHNPLIDATVAVDVGDPGSLAAAERQLLPVRWQWVISLDDEAPLCRLAATLDYARLSGAHWPSNRAAPTYTDDVAPWFDMGLLSRHGKEQADRLKVANRRSHPAIYAAMLGIEMGRPELRLPDAAAAWGRAFAGRHDLGRTGPTVGLNTGAGGRWRSKELPEERVVGLLAALHAALGGATFLLLGGPSERDRNRRIAAEAAKLPAPPRVVDAGADNDLLQFAAIVDHCDLVVTSDSLALHVAIARRRRIVAFFAPTSAAEIELYGLGEKVVSTAPDYCSYRPDADNSTITVDRLAAACTRVLAAG